MKKLLINRSAYAAGIIMTFICGTLFPPSWDFGVASAADRYVSLNGTNDTAGGYTNWVGAATQIQWAVNVALDNEKVWVSNGVYVLTNQISISPAIALKSLNGRTVTSINGNYPVVTNRCFDVLNALVKIDGFSISNGYSQDPGGAYAEGWGGGIRLKTSGTVINCLVSRCNVAYRGGGIYCQSSGQSTISNCVIEYNGLLGNWGAGGIVASANTLIINCIISHNNGGTESGGGVMGNTSTNSIIRNCVISYNTGGGIATTLGGAGITQPSVVENCTIVGNSSGAGPGGGIGQRSTIGETNVSIKNCIIYSNSAPAGSPQNWSTNMAGAVFSNNCTDTTNGMVGSGNITNVPLFTDWATTNLRLSASSPCVNKGINQGWMTGAVDLDGHSRIDRFFGIVDMGSYEYLSKGTVFGFR